MAKPEHSSDTSDSLLTFLNRGSLPFVGRDAELRQIIQFWEGTARADEMRLALLIGEAGQGKSRLIEEATLPITARGGIVPHVKIYPESTTSLLVLLSRSLAVDPATSSILRADPEPTLVSVADALRRLSRLRPVMLVVEDVHLLAGSSLAEFAQILEALADESLSILCAARPVDMGARGAMERWLTDQITLRGLDDTAVEQIWQTLFQQKVEIPSITALQGATSGNPLAIRSALRGALAGALREEHSSESPPYLRLAATDLAQSFRHSVALLADGMTAHLSPEEFANAMQLAILGELFSAEAASVVIQGDAAAALRTLRYRGILSHAATGATPIPGNSSLHQPISFTHTLLHRRLIDQLETTPTSPELLWKLCTTSLPLYSFQPFLLLAPIAPQLSISAQEAHSGVAAIVARTKGMNVAVLETGGRVLLECGRAVAQAFSSQWSSDQQQESELLLIATDLRIRRLELYTDQFQRDVEQYLELAKNPDTHTIAAHRLNGLATIHAISNMRHYAKRHDTWEEGVMLVERYPELRRSDDWINFLRQLAQGSSLDHDIIRAVEREMEQMFQIEGIDPQFKERCWREIAPFLLDTFANESELEKRHQLCQRLLASPYVSDPQTLSRIVSFHHNTGQADRTLQLLERLLPLLKSHGILTNFYSQQIKRLQLHAGFGMRPSIIEAEVDRLIAEVPDPIRDGFRRFVGLILPQFYAQLGDDAALHDCIARRTQDRRQLFADVIALAAETPAEYQQALQQIRHGAMLPADISRLIKLLQHPESAQNPDVALVFTQFDMRALRLTDLIFLRLAFQLVGQLPEPLQKRLHGAGTALFNNVMEWLQKQELWAFMLPFLDRFGESYCNKKEAKIWRDRIAQLAEKRRPAEGEPNTKKIWLTMIGTIQAQLPDGTVVPIRGGRLRAVLGLMVADLMQKQPLEPREFRHLAAGGEGDPEHARKTMNAAVFRLRDLLGPQVIRTEGETPALNLDAVQVDLLLARQQLREAARALRDGALRRAYPAAMQALELTQGEVPFPSLYEELFEAAREDFEHLLRATTMRVASGLLREDDPASAEELLRRAHTMMPEDEEVMELLNNSLAQQGKRTESARLRLRAMMEEPA